MSRRLHSFSNPRLRSGFFRFCDLSRPGLCSSEGFVAQIIILPIIAKTMQLAQIVLYPIQGIGWESDKQSLLPLLSLPLFLNYLCTNAPVFWFILWISASFMSFLHRWLHQLTEYTLHDFFMHQRRNSHTVSKALPLRSNAVTTRRDNCVTQRPPSGTSDKKETVL